MPKHSHRVYDALKRIADVFVAVPLLIIAAPVIALTALVVLVADGAPVLFRQERPGRDGRIFTLYKFRSMRPVRAGENAAATDELRLTRTGRLLRASSLDELPQLVNVLKGDMSFIGPRPLLPEYLPRYSQEQARRHEIRPGITGWAQVNGRNSTTWDERFKLDVYYVDNRSFMLDVTILVRTVAAVFTSRGISAADHATMPPFMPETSEKSSSDDSL